MSFGQKFHELSEYFVSSNFCQFFKLESDEFLFVDSDDLFHSKWFFIDSKENHVNRKLGIWVTPMKLSPNLMQHFCLCVITQKLKVTWEWASTLFLFNCIPSDSEPIEKNETSPKPEISGVLDPVSQKEEKNENKIGLERSGKLNGIKNKLVRHYKK